MASFCNFICRRAAIPLLLLFSYCSGFRISPIENVCSVSILQRAARNMHRHSRPQSFHLSTTANSNDGEQKWENGVEDEFGEKIESVKSAVFAAVGGTVAVIPFAIIRGALLHYNAEWEFNYYGLLILTAPLFGITYRYAIRRDNNPNLKQGVIGAFVITRAVATVKVDDICSSIPLNCGPPFYLFTDQMLIHGLINFAEAGICFAGSAYLMETLFKSKALSKFPKMREIK